MITGGRLTLPCARAHDTSVLGSVGRLLFCFSNGIDERILLESVVRKKLADDDRLVTATNGCKERLECRLTRQYTISPCISMTTNCCRPTHNVRFASVPIASQRSFYKRTQRSCCCDAPTATRPALHGCRRTRP